MRGYFKSALAVFLSLERNDVPAPMRSAALSMAATCVVGSGGGAEDEAPTLWFKASRRDPTRRDPLLQLARHALSKGEFQGAASFSAAALAIPGRVGFSELEENLLEGAHAILYWALFWLGRRDEARPHFEICRTLDPLNPVYLNHAHLFG